ncbi:hypothetical protein QYZ88_005235 [Lachnospiraceae bacterium C1.1]|nr:hypothetical protein [Lachnospiraceae bacterium C1.1]
MENNTIFREKSIKRISSPEQLNDYIRLNNIGIWLVLGALVIILAGACIFGAVGHIDSTVPGVCISDGERVICYIKKDYSDKFTDEMYLKIGEREYPAFLNSSKPIQIGEDFDSYAMFLADMKNGEWVYEVTVAEYHPDLREGIYEALIVTEKISPLSFIFGKQ